jgi:hypothetical protein
VDVAVGKALNRDIRSIEQVDGELDAFIERRHRQRVREEGEREIEAAWEESTRRFNAARDAELRAEWSAWHLSQAERHKAVLFSLIKHHEEQAEKLGGDAA